jgi:hypothetical protein
MKLYPPSTLTIEESLERLNTERELGEMNVTDSRLKDYAQEFLTHYRATLEDCFQL